MFPIVGHLDVLLYKSELGFRQLEPGKSCAVEPNLRVMRTVVV